MLFWSSSLSPALFVGERPSLISLAGFATKELTNEHYQGRKLRPLSRYGCNMQRHLHAFMHLPFDHVAHETCWRAQDLGFVGRYVELEVLYEVGNHSLHLDQPACEQLSSTRGWEDGNTHANRQLWDWQLAYGGWDEENSLPNTPAYSGRYAGISMKGWTESRSILTEWHPIAVSHQS